MKVYGRYLRYMKVYEGIWKYMEVYKVYLDIFKKILWKGRKGKGMSAPERFHFTTFYKQFTTL